MASRKKSYFSDISDDKWTVVAPYHAVLPEDPNPCTYVLDEDFIGPPPSVDWRRLASTGARCPTIPTTLTRVEPIRNAHLASPVSGATA